MTIIMCICMCILTCVCKCMHDMHMQGTGEMMEEGTGRERGVRNKVREEGKPEERW